MKTFNPLIYSDTLLAQQEFDRLMDGKKPIKMGNDTDRTPLQSRARWLYLTMVADKLTSMGERYYISKIDAYIPFSKDLLYAIYWQTLRETMFEGVSKLNIKQFGELTDAAQDLFARIYQIAIPFPDIKRLKEEHAPNK